MNLTGQIVEYNYLAGIYALLKQQQARVNQAATQDPHNLNARMSQQKINDDIQAIEPVVFRLQNQIMASMERKYGFRLKTVIRQEPPKENNHK